MDQKISIELTLEQLERVSGGTHVTETETPPVSKAPQMAASAPVPPGPPVVDIPTKGV